MICTLCRDAGKKSYVCRYGSRIPFDANGYFDEEGRFHAHAPSDSVFVYICSLGHCWERALTEDCPSCKAAEIYATPPADSQFVVTWWSKEQVRVGRKFFQHLEDAEEFYAAITLCSEKELMHVDDLVYETMPDV